MCLLAAMAGCIPARHYVTPPLEVHVVRGGAPAPGTPLRLGTGSEGSCHRVRRSASTDSTGTLSLDRVGAWTWMFRARRFQIYDWQLRALQPDSTWREVYRHKGPDIWGTRECRMDLLANESRAICVPKSMPSRLTRS